MNKRKNILLLYIYVLISFEPNKKKLNIKYICLQKGKTFTLCNYYKNKTQHRGI